MGKFDRANEPSQVFLFDQKLIEAREIMEARILITRECGSYSQVHTIGYDHMKIGSEDAICIHCSNDSKLTWNPDKNCWFEFRKNWFNGLPVTDELGKVIQSAVEVIFFVTDFSDDGLTEKEKEFVFEVTK